MNLFKQDALLLALHVRELELEQGSLKEIKADVDEWVANTEAVNGEWGEEGLSLVPDASHPIVERYAEYSSDDDDLNPSKPFVALKPLNGN